MADSEQARSKGRSPNYPGVNLETALKRAQQLYQQERRNAAHMDAILHHWGYAPKSGGGRVAFAALKKFGLLIEEGSGARRRGRLSDLGLRIIQDERPNSAERYRAIQQAALMPPIHRELWEEYQGSLPSDENLRFMLLNERAFTEAGANDFIEQFRATIAFAGLDQPDSMPPQMEDKAPSGAHFAPGPLAPSTTEEPSIQIFLSPGRPARLFLPSGTTPAEWERLKVVFDAAVPGVLEAPEAVPSPSDNGEGGEPEE
jgi:hypothetical protein